MARLRWRIEDCVVQSAGVAVPNPNRTILTSKTLAFSNLTSLRPAIHSWTSFEPDDASRRARWFRSLILRPIDAADPKAGDVKVEANSQCK
jgi:hypothetical protein